MTQGLIDRRALAAHRRRAKGASREAYFPHQEAEAQIQERLSEVKRTFTSPALVTSRPDIFTALARDWRVVADEEVLDLEDAEHDLVVHALSLHWAEDPVGQLIQCRRALVDDGLFLAATLGGRTLTELRTALATAETEIASGISPRVLPMADTRDWGTLLQRAGFALPVADSFIMTAHYLTLFSLMHDLRAMGETNALAGRVRRPSRRALFQRAETIYHEAFARGDGLLPATFDIIFLTGWAPGPGQPVPLRPGSATRRLADALRTEERPAGDPIANRND